jgi:molecular chaperone Hsp33
MIDTPIFLDTDRPDVPDTVVPRGVVPFHLRHAPVRGRMVQLGPLAEALLSRRTLDDAAMRLGGEALALVAALSATLKFQGSFSLQIKGDGPVSTLVTDSSDSGALRLYIKADTESGAGLPADASAGALLGAGYLAFTVDPGGDTERSQGIVEITGDSLAEMAMHYFETSEQHACWIRLFCDRTDAGWRAGALVLERIAAGGGVEDVVLTADGQDAWDTAVTLAETVTRDEILDDALDGTILLNRLFGTLDLAIGQPRALAYGCRCSRARLAGLLETFPEEDLDHMAVNDQIIMTCEFCNVDFSFPRNRIMPERDPS